MSEHKEKQDEQAKGDICVVPGCPISRSRAVGSLGSRAISS